MSNLSVNQIITALDAKLEAKIAYHADKLKDITTTNQLMELLAMRATLLINKYGVGSGSSGAGGDTTDLENILETISTLVEASNVQTSYIVSKLEELINLATPLTRLAYRNSSQYVIDNIKSSSGRLWYFTARNDSSEELFLMFFNSVSVPQAGEIPYQHYILQPDDLLFFDDEYDFSNGISIGWSTLENSFMPASSPEGKVFQAIYS